MGPAAALLVLVSSRPAGVPVSAARWPCVQEDADGARGRGVLWRGCGDHSAGSPCAGPRQARFCSARGIHWGLSRKEPFCSAGLGRCPGEWNGSPPPCSCPGNPLDRGVWRAAVRGAAELDTTARLNDDVTQLTRRQPRPPRPSPRRREVAGSWGPPGHLVQGNAHCQQMRGRAGPRLSGRRRWCEFWVNSHAALSGNLGR